MLARSGYPHLYCCVSLAPLFALEALGFLLKREESPLSGRFKVNSTNFPR